jgi:hypothetical protein
MREAFRDERGDPIVYKTFERRDGKRRVALRFALVEGRLVCIGVEIGPLVKHNGENAEVFIVSDESELDPLRSTELRLPLRELIDEALEWVIIKDQDFAWMGSERAAEWKKVVAPHNAAVRKGRKKPGRPRQYGDDHYQKVAEVYEQELRSGGRAPLRAVMREFHVEKSTAASWVREAKRLGFLTMEYFAGGESEDG